jgi:hypothetical protein
MDRPTNEREQKQRDETIVAGQGAVADELTDGETGDAHRKEGTTAVHHESGHEEIVGREGGLTDRIILDKGGSVPRHPQG